MGVWPSSEVAAAMEPVEMRMMGTRIGAEANTKRGERFAELRAPPALEVDPAGPSAPCTLDPAGPSAP